MPWRRVQRSGQVPAEWKRKTRFLVDENLGGEVALYLREKGFDAVSVEDAGLKGRTDEDVLASAWREERMLLTLDRDYLDDRRFPEHRNPGVVILSGGGGNDHELGMSHGIALAVFGTAPTLLRQAKVTISGDGHMTVRQRHFDSGIVAETRFRLKGGHYEQWED